jgi:hypothetical protein
MNIMMASEEQMLLNNSRSNTRNTIDVEITMENSDVKSFPKNRSQSELRNPLPTIHDEDET